MIPPSSTTPTLLNLPSFYQLFSSSCGISTDFQANQVFMPICVRASYKLARYTLEIILKNFILGTQKTPRSHISLIRCIISMFSDTKWTSFHSVVTLSLRNLSQFRFRLVKIGIQEIFIFHSSSYSL